MCEHDDFMLADPECEVCAETRRQFAAWCKTQQTVNEPTDAEKSHLYCYGYDQ